MVQTSVSQILEQIANALVSIGAALFLIHIFVPDSAARIGEMLGKTLSGQPALYGAAAGAVLAGQDAA